MGGPLDCTSGMNLIPVTLPAPAPANDDGTRSREVVDASRPAQQGPKRFGPGDYIDMGNGRFMSWERFMSE